MSNTSSRLGILSAEGTDDANVPQFTNAIVAKVDAQMMVYASGTIANRPTSTPGSPGINGRAYYATDEQRLYIDYGTGWAVIDGGDPGDIKVSARPTAPTGWLPCDGAAISRTTYALLFAAIGTAYGAGNGSSTFNVPDFRDRVPLGASGGRPRGTTGGVESVALSVSELPSHNHGGATGSPNVSLSHNHGGATGSMNRNNPHYHTYTESMWQNVNVNGGSAFGVNAAQKTPQSWTSITDINHEHAIGDSGALSHTHSIPSQGGGDAHTNMMPFLASSVFIKTGL